MIKIIFIHFFLFLVQLICAQEQNANWYFGENAGLNFSSGASVLTDGQTIGGKTATISDVNGELLFYSDGRSVWNKNHTKMTNGNETILGDSDNVVICPMPGHLNKYYLFTSKDTYSMYSNTYSTSYYYTIINMSDGLGIVESLNNDLGILPYIAEEYFNHSERYRMTLIKHADDESYWLVVNPLHYFFAKKIDASGISSSVVSRADGDYYYGDPLESKQTRYGEISVSSDSSKIAYLMHSSTPGSDAGVPYCKVYDFDNETGILTLNGAIGEAVSDYFWNYLVFNGFSVEFSPDNNYLYVLAYDGNYILSQFDIRTPNDAPIILASKEYNGNYYSSQMRLAKDGKIYLPFSEEGKLAVINNPNNKGLSCNFVDNQIDLDEGKGRYLPQLIPIHNYCLTNINITDNISTGSVNNISVQNTIIATNTINSGATANYDAGTTVYLKPGFHAESGSNFRTFIEGCAVSSAKSIDAVEKQEVLKEENILLNSDTTIYPNPTTGIFTISSNEIISNYAVLNTSGNKLLEKEVNSDKIAVNIQSLSSGVYMVHMILSSGEFIVKKIIKR